MKRAGSPGTSNGKGKNLDRLITDYARGRRTSLENYIIGVNSRIHLLPASNNISLIEEYLTDAIIKKSRESGGHRSSNHRNILLKNLFEKTVDMHDYDFVLIDS